MQGRLLPLHEKPELLDHAPEVLRAAQAYLDNALRNLAKQEYELAKIKTLLKPKKDAQNALALAAGSSTKNPNP